MKAKIGRWAFIIGLIIAVIAGFLGTEVMAWVTPALVVLGVVVGFLNIQGEEVRNFLVATIALMLVGSVLASLPVLGELVTNVVVAFTSFVSGAAIIVALREILSVAKE